MSIDFDLSLFRLVKSFAAVEISRNVGASGPDDGVVDAPDDRPRLRETIASAPVVRAGLASVTGNAASSATEHIPDHLDDAMRAALERGLEGAEREAVGWQGGQRNAALSLAGLARPGGMAESRQIPASPSGPGNAPDAGPAESSRLQTSHAKPSAASVSVLTDAAPVDPAGTETARPSSGAVTSPIATTPVLQSVPTDKPPLAALGNPQPGAVAGDAGPDDPRPAALGSEKPPSVSASNISLYGEAQIADALQSMAEEQASHRNDAAAADRRTIRSEPIRLAAADEAFAVSATARDPLKLSTSSLGGVVGGVETVPVTEAVMGGIDDADNPAAQADRAERLPARARTATQVQAQALDAQAVHEPDVVDARRSRTPEGRGLQAHPVDVANRPDRHGSEPVPVDSRSEASGQRPDGRHPMPVAAMPSVKVVEILDALVALSVSAGEGSEDWQSLSSVILNAAMIPGWPPPRPVENPASVKQADPLMQVPQSAEAAEAEPSMTPEQMLAYLMSIGANLRLLRALQELVGRVEKKSGPALLAWLAGLVSALKVIEKSLKDIVEDGMDLPEWLADLADAAKRPRRRKQFHI
jgi:hypothetical protein